MSRNDIDAKVEEVFVHFFPDFPQRVFLPPLDDVVEGFTERYKIPFYFDYDLGIGDGGKKILGRFDFHPRAIFVDRSLRRNGPRFRWTLAHEIGHLVLHRNITKDGECISREPRLVDTRTELRYGKKAKYSDLQWIEWQASQFAAAMILPRAALCVQLVRFQKSELHLGNAGRIYVDDQPVNRHLYRQTIEHLIRVFNTSVTILHRRLQDLGLLQDDRSENRARIGYLMKSLLDTDW